MVRPSLGSTEYKVAARSFARMAGSPRFVVVRCTRRHRWRFTDSATAIATTASPPEFAPGDTLALGAPRPDCSQSDAVLGTVEAWPGNANHTRPSSRRPASTAP